MLGHWIVSQHFMEPEGSIPNSRDLSTCSYPSQANPVHITPHPTYPRSILILSTHLRLGLPSGLFPSGFPTNNLYAFLFSPIRATWPAHLIIIIIIIIIKIVMIQLIMINLFEILIKKSWRKDRLRDLGVDGRILLTYLKETALRRALDSTGSGEGPVSRLLLTLMQQCSRVWLF
jgi:hypothetical protein